MGVKGMKLMPCCNDDTRPRGDTEKKGGSERWWLAESGIGCRYGPFLRILPFCAPSSLVRCRAVGLLGSITSIYLYILYLSDVLCTYDVFELGAEPGVTRGIRGPHHPHHLVRREVRIVHRVVRLGAEREKTEGGAGKGSR